MTLLIFVPIVINFVVAFVLLIVGKPKLFFVEKSISNKSGKVFNTVTCIAKQIFAYTLGQYVLKNEC